KALSSSAWHFHYDAEFKKIGKHADLLFSSDGKFPTVRTHFFGYGNNSSFDKSKGADYYKIRYNLVDVSLMIRNSISSWLQLKYGLLLQYFKLPMKENKGQYIGTVIPSGITDRLVKNNWYSG